MRRNNTQTIGEVIEQYLKSMKLDRRMKEMRLIREWEDLMGKTIAAATHDIFIKNGVMYVSLTSSVVRSELFMVRQSIAKALNDRIGEPLIKEVVLK